MHCVVFCFHRCRGLPLCQYLNITTMTPKITTKRFSLEEGINRGCRRFRTRLDRVMKLYNQNGVPLRRLSIVLPVLIVCVAFLTASTNQEVSNTQNTGAPRTSCRSIDMTAEMTQWLGATPLRSAPALEVCMTQHPSPSSVLRNVSTTPSGTSRADDLCVRASEYGEEWFICPRRQAFIFSPLTRW